MQQIPTGERLHGIVGMGGYADVSAADCDGCQSHQKVIQLWTPDDNHWLHLCADCLRAAAEILDSNQDIPDAE